MKQNKKTKNDKSDPAIKKEPQKNDDKPFVQHQSDWAVDYGKK